MLSLKLTAPLFLTSNELTAPIFWRSPPPLRVAIWQWVAIWYLSYPPPPNGMSPPSKDSGGDEPEVGCRRRGFGGLTPRPLTPGPGLVMVTTQSSQRRCQNHHNHYVYLLMNASSSTPKTWVTQCKPPCVHFFLGGGSIVRRSPSRPFQK